jgi:hypothetical protein
MSNIELWRFRLKDYVSPDIFIDWAYYSLIAACLQRRIYLGSDQMKLHGNMFIVLVGPPGVGKGLMLGEVAKILANKKLSNNASFEERREELSAEFGDLPAGNPFDSMNNMKIPLAPNATTFEALCRILCKSARHIRVPTGKKTPDGTPITKVEQHCSLYATLEELGSLVRQHTQDTHVLLQEIYDCKDKYEYSTKNQGNDFIKRPCFNLLAGTTPDFLKRAYMTTLLTEGFSSRTVFVVAFQNRFRSYHTPTFSEEQNEAYAKILDHVVKVCNLQGGVKFTEEAQEFNKTWYEKDYGIAVPNPHPKLQPYYSRIGITHQKLCMAMHFGESLDLEIGIDVCKKALKLLQETEKTMHLAIGIEMKNPLSEVKDLIHKYMVAKAVTVTKKELFQAFYDNFPSGEPSKDLDTVIGDLKMLNKIIEAPEGKAGTYRITENDK